MNTKSNKKDCILLLLFTYFYVLSSVSDGAKKNHKRRNSNGIAIYLLNCDGKLVALIVWCRELQSEFCNRLRITSREPLKSGLTSSADALRLIICISVIIGNTELKSYHCSGSGQSDILNGLHAMQVTYYVAQVYDCP